MSRIDQKAGDWKMFGAALLTLCMSAIFVWAHESPVDHVEREFTLRVENEVLHVGYRVQYSERSILLQFHSMDTDHDGKISEAERAKFFEGQAQTLAGLFKLEVEGRPLLLQPSTPVKCDARLGQTYSFTAPLGALGSGKHAGLLTDGYSRVYPGPYKWQPSEPTGPGKAFIRALPQTPGHEKAHASTLTLNFEVHAP